MIQFNLLPQVKLSYLRAQYARKVVTLVSAAVTGGSILILAIVLSVYFYKTQNLASLTKEIKASSETLAKETEVNQKLTVQNQLSRLTGLHDSKPAAPRLFDYLNQVTPNKVIGISELKVNYVDFTISIAGVSDSLTSVNKYVDTLKFTDYKIVPNEGLEASSDKKERAFKGVVLSEFSYETKDAKTGVSELPATFTILMSYDEVIFNVTQNVKLEVPSIITTRSAVNLPSELLKAAPEKAVEKDGGTN